MSPDQRPTVLIVDDVPTNIQVLGEALMDDCDILVATNGEDALEIAAAPERPDLVLLDVLMPGLDGYEVCERLKRDTWTESIPVIFVTAKSEEADEARGLEIGAVDYVTKPFSMAIVRARVRTHLELKRHRDMLEEQSRRDGLTGIANRRRFDEHLAMAWRHGAREGTPVSLLLADIDFFKRYNDHYGHLGGDDCLRRVATALADCSGRPLDVVARYGGEEFGCILPGTDQQGALRVARAMQAAVMALGVPHSASPVAECVTVSLGAATLRPSHGASLQDLIRRADVALYDAKQAGRNCVRGSTLPD